MENPPVREPRRAAPGIHPAEARASTGSLIEALASTSNMAEVPASTRYPVGATTSTSLLAKDSASTSRTVEAAPTPRPEALSPLLRTRLS
ncbi:UNVERIFIED_CONTAM: hypothetical protein Slati_2750300 [Sesamum latifolium]|uniref:Uncharacterized protein n=1 Tax=Sesamum latifolium TaxID=2727402 RepID=A0AAW2W1I2_9LAMI